MRLAVRGALPLWAIALLLPGTFVIGVARLLGPGFARRNDFWIIALGACLGLPMLGASGLVDPWETHYAEVARAMIERHDLVSPWWANEGWFRSKPILTFWLEALSLFVFGARTGDDQVLLGQPEWAIRNLAFALIGTYFLHDGVARLCGKRAALLGAIALSTMPGFALLRHQALTDMPLVGGVAAALGLLLRATATNDVVLATRRLRFTVAIAIGIATIGQCMLLVSHGQLAAGDPHACGLPGQPACAVIRAAYPRLRPALQACLWLTPSVWLVACAWSETRAARLVALGAWFFAALAAMAKGPAGLVVPAGAMLVVLVTRRSLRDLARLEIGAGLLLVMTMIAPWYLAAFARHGRPFLDELVLRNMLGRALDHLHDTNEGEDVGIVYFVRQLGYATFPWCGLAPIAVLAAARVDRGKRAGARALLFGATLVAFGLVSWMRTKFHHYVLVAIPPIAMLTGIGLDELLTMKTGARRKWAAFALGAAATVVALVGRDAAAAPTRFIGLLSYRYGRVWPSTLEFRTTIFVTTVASVAFLLAAIRWRTKAIVLFAASAVVFTALLLDVYLVRCADDGGQRGLLATYYREREASGARSAP